METMYNEHLSSLLKKTIQKNVYVIETYNNYFV